jgi:hypothetical protein
MTATTLTTLLSTLLLLGSPPTRALAQAPPARPAMPPAAPAQGPAAADGPGVVIAEEHASDGAVAEPRAEPPPWAATLRAGVFVLRSSGVPGHPVGPDVELTLGRTIYDMVAVELNVGAYQVSLTGTGTTLKVVPVSVSLKLTAAPEYGFEPFAVFGLGFSPTRLSGGSLAAASSTAFTSHAGIGTRYRLGEHGYTGLDVRYVFQDVSGPPGRVDGLRLSLMGGALF